MGKNSKLAGKNSTPAGATNNTATKNYKPTVEEREEAKKRLEPIMFAVTETLNTGSNKVFMDTMEKYNFEEVKKWFEDAGYSRRKTNIILSIGACDVDNAGNRVTLWNTGEKTINTGSGVSGDCSDKHNIRFSSVSLKENGPIYDTLEDKPLRGERDEKEKSKEGKQVYQRVGNLQLHEAVLITSRIIGWNNPENQRELIEWMKDPEAQINHKNGNLYTHDADLVEVCTTDENDKHQDAIKYVPVIVSIFEKAHLLDTEKFYSTFKGFSAHQSGLGKLKEELKKLKKKLNQLKKYEPYDVMEQNYRKLLQEFYDILAIR